MLAVGRVFAREYLIIYYQQFIAQMERILLSARRCKKSNSTKTLRKKLSLFVTVIEENSIQHE